MVCEAVMTWPGVRDVWNHQLGGTSGFNVNPCPPDLVCEASHTNNKLN